MEAIVIGGTGFLGSWVTKKLLQCGYSVSVISRTGIKKELENFWNQDVKEIQMDVTKDDLTKIPKRELVFYFALPAYPDVLDIQLNSVLMPIRGVINVLRYTEKYKTPLIFASTGSVYGNYRKKIKENFYCKPVTVYEAASYFADTLCRLYIAKGLKIMILRYFFPYGPGQRRSQFIPKIFEKTLKGETVEIRGSLNDVRDFIYVEDAAECTIKLATNKTAYGQVFNVCRSVPIKIKQLLDETEEICGKKVNIRLTNRKSMDHPYIVGDNTKLQKLLNHDFVTLHEGLSKTFKALKNDRRETC